MSCLCGTRCSWSGLAVSPLLQKPSNGRPGSPPRLGSELGWFFLWVIYIRSRQRLSYFKQATKSFPKPEWKSHLIKTWSADNHFSQYMSSNLWNLGSKHAWADGRQFIWIRSWSKLTPTCVIQGRNSVEPDMNVFYVIGSEYSFLSGTEAFDQVAINDDRRNERYCNGPASIMFASS